MNRLVSVGLTFALCMPAAFAQPAPGTPDVKALVDDLRGSNLAHRDEATSKLLALGDKAGAAVPALLACLSDPDPGVRRAAVNVLGSVRTDPRQAVPALVRALADEDPPEPRTRTPVSRAAALSLGRYGKEAREAVPALFDIAQNGKDPQMRGVCLVALGGIGAEGKKVVPFLTRLLEDPEFRGAAAGALAGFGDEAAAVTPQLLEAYEKDDIREPNRVLAVRGAILIALASSGKDADRHLPLFVEVFLSDRRGTPRSSARQALEVLGPRAAPALPRILEVVAGPEYNGEACHHLPLIAHAIGQKEVDPLVGLLGRSRPEYARNAALNSLTRMGATAEKALPHLAELTQDPDANIARKARKAAADIRAALDARPAP